MSSPKPAARPSFSIVIPTRNEAQDIRLTLERCLAIRWDAVEILVVDDSSDETPEIVAGYADRGVRLLHREVNLDGCCGARNLGMRNARGDVIVLLNADAVPAPDFLERLAPHYEEGADWVILRSRVCNLDTIWGRYLAALEKERWAGVPFEPWWSEGVSFRRTAVEAVGWIPGHFPIRFCRDNILGPRLAEAGFVKHVDASIQMDHVVPDDFRGFWHHRVWRGTLIPPNLHYFQGGRFPSVALREGAKLLRALLVNGLVLPRLVIAARQARHVGGWRRVPELALAGAIDEVAYLVGSWRGLVTLYRAAGLGRPLLPPPGVAGEEIG